MPIQTVSQAVSNEVHQTTPFFFRNRVINGDYKVDQRNLGAALTNQSAYLARPADMCRTGGGNLTTGRYSAQRMSSLDSSVTGYEVGSAPEGFTNSVKYTVTATETESSGAGLFHSHFIEGYQLADFGFGTATTKKFTLSFWIKSSVAGTYELQLNNSASPYTAYYTTYTINQTNTWEYKTITVPIPTNSSIAWNKTSGTGLRLDFALKRESSAGTVSTTNTWLTGTDADNKEVGGSIVNLFATNGATWYITGLQVELGNLATPFENKPYQTELVLCQRYFQTGRFVCFPLMYTNHSGGAGGTPSSFNVYMNEITLGVPMRNSGGTITPCRYDKAVITSGSYVSRTTNEGDYSGLIAAAPYLRFTEPNTIFIYFATSNGWYPVPVYFTASTEF
jgi:hypothetical protein